MMTAKERIILLRMLEKQEKNQKYLDKIGVQIKLTRKSEMTAVRRNEHV